MQPTGDSAHPEPIVTRTIDPTDNGSAGAATHNTSDLFPYLIPMGAYVALGATESFLPQIDGHPSPIWYFGAYTAKLIAVGWLAWWYRSAWTDLRPLPRVADMALSVFLGLIVCGLWIGLDGLYPAIPLVGRRVGFDPTTLAPVPRFAFLVGRFAGLVLLVPVIEELFWRSFLIRWLIDPDFRKVPIGRVTLMSAAVTSVFFALVHPEWLPALLTGLLWAWLLGYTRSVSACVVSHVTANLALGLYIVGARAWQYW